MRLRGAIVNGFFADAVAEDRRWAGCDVLTQRAGGGFARRGESDSLGGWRRLRPFWVRCEDAWTGFRTSVAE